ncbi:MAG: nucleotidyltransferase domain-containing protein, partial [Betaproteobacteria bacterium]
PFLDRFVDAALDVLGTDLVSIILFGSAALGRLRATSDVNVLVVIRDWKPERTDRLREPLRTAIARIRLAPLFIRSDELHDAALAFADRFSDILRRRRVLYGEDAVDGIVIPRAALIARERQSLLNNIVRLRQTYLVRSLRPEDAALAVAEMAGPLRGSAATLLELSGRGVFEPKEALQVFVEGTRDASLTTVLDTMSAVREERELPHGVAPAALASLETVAMRLRAAYGALAT